MSRRNILVATLIGLGALTTALLVVSWSPGRRLPTATLRCTSPAAPSTRVTVTLTDMGQGMMGGDGPMRLLADQDTVAAGEVTFQAVNTGTLTHELVVLPLESGHSAGARTPGSDGRVQEDRSVGEASNTCAAGAGTGIAPAGVGWVSVHLSPGRYELVCNEPGHYSAGMYSTLTVTGGNGS